MTISGSGDTEITTFTRPGDYFDSENWLIGVGDFQVVLNKYRSGASGFRIQYRTASSQDGLAGASWTDTTGSVTSLGWINIRVYYMDTR